MVWEDPITHDRRPTSGAFQPDADGVSVYRRARLEEAGLGVEAIITTQSAIVVSLTVEDVRSVKPLGVRDDPWPKDIPDAEHPRNCAHALIIGWHSAGGKKKRLACQRALANATSLQFVNIGR